MKYANMCNDVLSKEVLLFVAKIKGLVKNALGLESNMKIRVCFNLLEAHETKVC